VSAYDLSTAHGRLGTYLRYIFNDHAYLRLVNSNAHWISNELARANQPWPFQVRAWRDRGIRTIVNLRHGVDAHHVLEEEACDKYGVKHVYFVVFSREVPSAGQILGAKKLFEELEYPAMMHCKSGADRAGLMSVLYMHFRQGLPIREAIRQLDLRFGHIRASLTGVLDYFFEKYINEIEPRGISFEEWVQSSEYDPVALKHEFRSQWWGTLLSDKILRRE
jgi:protein tyrosine/serine phosphatase